MPDMNGVLNAVYDPATSSLRTVNGGTATPAEGGELNGVWSDAFDSSGALRVVAVD